MTRKFKLVRVRPEPPMTAVATEEAQATLPDLIDMAASEVEVVILRKWKPGVRLQRAEDVSTPP